MSEPLLLLVLPGLDAIAKAIDRGEEVANQLPAITRLVTFAEREYHPFLDGAILYCDAIRWLRSRAEVSR